MKNYNPKSCDGLRSMDGRYILKVQCLDAHPFDSGRRGTYVIQVLDNNFSLDFPVATVMTNKRDWPELLLRMNFDVRSGPVVTTPDKEVLLSLKRLGITRVYKSLVGGDAIRVYPPKGGSTGREWHLRGCLSKDVVNFINENDKVDIDTLLSMVWGD